jgi:phenylacetate-CoA ligase
MQINNRDEKSFRLVIMNWRKPLIYLSLYAAGNKIPNYLKQIKKYEFLGREKNAELINRKLEALLLHAYNNVPYYHRILDNCGVIKDNKVNLDNFSRIPVLTKEIIRHEGKNLYSNDYKKRKSYENTSGGSTGEPVRFIQDVEYDQWNIATKLYFNLMLGKDVGAPEIKFWGSDRDIIEGNLTLKDRLINFLYNRKFFNSYQLNTEKIRELINLNNRFKPAAYWSYMESALELSNFLAAYKVNFYPPRIVISTIGPLTDEVRKKIESAMKCKVYNQYGSREVGAIACQCREQKGLHTFPWWNYVEILDKNHKPVEAGQQGDVFITTLHNFSMPLIRYELGDVAVAGQYQCPCGRSTFQLQTVLGRTLGYFKKSDGSLAHSHFIVQTLFFRDWIKSFQVIQDAIDHILIRLELREVAKPPKEDLDDIVRKTKILMGQNCAVDFEFTDHINKSASGKNVYTICKV